MEWTLFLFFVSLFAVILAIYIASRRQKRVIDTFLIANRSTPLLIGVLTIALAWTWAPAILVSSQMAYQQGMAGFLWFSVPNILALLIFPFLLKKARSFYEEGYTLPQIIKLKTRSNLTLSLYVLAIFVIQIYAITINFLGSFLVIRYLTNLDQYTSALIVFSIFTAIAFFRGLKSSILTDVIKSIFIFVALFLLLYVVFAFNLLPLANVNGKSQIGLQVFNKDLVLSYGIPTAISLLAAITIDQQQWQRGLSLKKNTPIFKTYIFSAIVFGFILVLMSLPGFIGVGLPFGKNIQTQIISLYLIEKYSKFIALFLSFAILISLIAVGAASVNAAASVGIVDLYSLVSKKKPEERNIKTYRIILVIFALLTFLIATLPNLQIIYIQMLVGSFRAALVIPTWFIIFSKKTRKDLAKYLNISIIIGMIAGPTIFLGGDMFGISTLRGYASLISLIFPILGILLFEGKERVKRIGRGRR
jgi:Na+/proline symporter